MRYITTLVYIICLLIFFGIGPYAPEPLPNKGRADFSKDAIDHKEETINDAKAILQRVRLPLEGRTICIDPGHQSRILKVKVPIAPGQDHRMPNYSIGTKGVETQVFEYTIALKVAMELDKKLRSLGAQVVLTRQSDEVAVGNMERAQIAAESYADITLSLHCDGIEDEKIYGLSVLYPGNKYIQNSGLLEKSKVLSQAILTYVTKAAKARNRGLSLRNDLIVFNYSRNPCALIELGFLTNPQEDRLLNTASYQSSLVEGITEGILEYFSLISD